MQKQERGRDLSSCSPHKPCAVNRCCKWSKANMTVTAALASLLCSVSWPSADISISPLSGASLKAPEQPSSSLASFCFPTSCKTHSSAHLGWPLLSHAGSSSQQLLLTLGDGFSFLVFVLRCCTAPLMPSRKKWMRRKWREMHSQVIMMEIV